jgi:predicted RNase H-like nuclease (RuvC/YqgF family)
VSTSLSSDQISERLAAVEHELVAAKNSLPAAQRVAAQAHLEADHNGYRADAVDVIHAKIARLKDVLSGLRQLAAGAQYAEISKQIEKLQREHKKTAARVEELRTKWHDLRRNPSFEREGIISAAHASFIEAHSLHAQEQAAIDALAARRAEIEAEYPEAVAA